MTDPYGSDQEWRADTSSNDAVVRQSLPRWRVVLHDDEVSDRPSMINAITQCTPLSHAAATQRVLAAHVDGTSLLLNVHRELAELYYVQLSKRNLIVTIEPDIDTSM